MTMTWPVSGHFPTSKVNAEVGQKSQAGVATRFPFLGSLPAGW